MDVVLWIVFAVSAALYWWVARVYVSQPKFNHPRLFWNPAVATTFLAAPLLGLLAVAVGGFVFTSNGWWFLGAAAAALVLLSAKHRAL